MNTHPKHLDNMSDEEISLLGEMLNLPLTASQIEEDIGTILESALSFAKLRTEYNNSLFIRSLIQLGNSLAVTIPKRIKEMRHLTSGSNIVLYYKGGDYAVLYFGKDNRPNDKETLPMKEKRQALPDKEPNDLQKIINFLKTHQEAHISIIAQKTKVKLSTIKVYLSKKKQYFQKSSKRGFWKLKSHVQTQKEDDT